MISGSRSANSLFRNKVKWWTPLLIRTKNFYQQNPPGTLKVVWILLNPTEFAMKIDLLIEVPDVAPSPAQKMTFLFIFPINKIMPIILLKLFETVNFGFMKTFDFFFIIAIFGVLFLFWKICITCFSQNQALDPGSNA